MQPKLKNRCSAAAIACLGALALTGLLPASAAAHRRYPIPVNVALLRPSMVTYRAYASGELADVAMGLQTLLAAEQAGNLATAEHDWLASHLAWLRIGQDDGAYGAFGNLGRRIDGTAAGYPQGVSDTSWTGFHRIEYELWTEQDVAAAASATATLQALITKLQGIGMKQELPGTATAIGNWVLRAHEILEDADRDTLTGDDDYGSGTGVASVEADAAATREMLKLLAPVLDPRAPKMVGRGDGDMSRIDRIAFSTRVQGRWIGVAQLPLSQRERLDAAVGGALENLAPISDIIDITGSFG